MKNKNVKRITKADCHTKHGEMVKMGISICPVCEKTLKDKPILITITTKAEIVFKEAA